MAFIDSDRPNRDDLRYFYARRNPVKRLLPILIVCFAVSAGRAQRLYLKAEGASSRESAIVDSIGYKKEHPNARSVSDEAAALGQRLRKGGWLSTEIRQSGKSNDSTFIYTYRIGSRVKSLHIYIGADPQLRALAFPDEKTDSVRIPFTETESFLNRALSAFEQKGYPLAKLRLDQLDQNRDIIVARLIGETGKPRQVNDLVINGYEKFPQSHRKQLLRLYRGRTFNRETLDKIYRDIGQFRFVTQTRYPEILFMQDTTKVYAYVEKAKANRFDGLIGFSNDDDAGAARKVRFSGYLDLLLVNALHGGEQFSLYWKSDGKKQTTFTAETQIPYIFRTPLALKAGLSIFKQDSTYQNTRTNLGLGYLFTYNKRLFLGYEATESSDIQNANSASVSDYKNKFATATFEFSQYRDADFLFPQQTWVSVRAGAGSRQSKVANDGQFFAEVNASRNFYLNDKNSIGLKTQDYLLDSGGYLLSELYRYGGINSIRGFAENSLQASALASLMAEYRYALAPGLYIHSITDYGYFLDQSRQDDGKRGSLLGLGFGFGLLSNGGLFHLVYANGTANGQPVKLSNSVVHVSFKANF